MELVSRKSINLPEELENRVYELRKLEQFHRCSFSEIVRQLIEKGLEVADEEESGRSCDTD